MQGSGKEKILLYQMFLPRRLQKPRRARNHKHIKQKDGRITARTRIQVRRNTVKSENIKMPKMREGRFTEKSWWIIWRGVMG